MVTHRVVIVDQERENRIFLYKLWFFIKYFFFPLIVGLFVGTYTHSDKIGIITFIVLMLLMIFRKKIFKRRIDNKKGSDWKKIDRLPDWAFKKMKRRRSNIVNGEHYRYKREGNKFYRRLK